MAQTSQPMGYDPKGYADKTVKIDSNIKGLF